MFDHQNKFAERIKIMPEEKVIIEKITDLLLEEKLITLEEKAKVSALIKEAAE